MKVAAPPGQHSIRLRSGPEAAARLHAWLDAAFAATPLPEPLAHAIRLCLEEAVMNVVMHGYGDRAGAIEVALWRETDGYCARVTDEAPAFDPASARPRPAPLSLEDGPPGGRGLLLLRRFAAGLDYARADGRNRLTLRFDD